MEKSIRSIFPLIASVFFSVGQPRLFVEFVCDPLIETSVASGTVLEELAAFPPFSDFAVPTTSRAPRRNFALLFKVSTNIVHAERQTKGREETDAEIEKKSKEEFERDIRR